MVWSNYAILSVWIFMSPDARAALPGAGLDDALEAFHTILIDGKFYSIFSLLFGIGFGFFLAKGNDGLWRFYRRMLILAVIGWVHVRYLWEGDILFLYALLGMLLPLFRRVPDRALLVVAMLLVLSPIAIDAVKVATDGKFDPATPMRVLAVAGDEDMVAHGADPDRIFHYVPEGGWSEFVVWQSGGFYWRFKGLLSTNRLPKVFAMFLIGLWIARRALFTDPAAHRKLLMRALVLGLAIGLPFNVLHWWADLTLKNPPMPEGLVRTLAYALGVAPLAIAYASGFALLWTSDRWRRRLGVLAPMGRMALTNYLMQTIIGLFLFAGIGLGWGARLSAVVFEALAIGVFTVQVFLSRWWLARFQYGPFEWAWRSLTYGRVMAIRKNA